MLLGPGLMYFLACFDTLLEAERAPNPKGFSPYRGDSASAGARHPSWPAAFTLPARWDDAENRARKGRYPSSESARVLVDQYFVDSLAVVFYVGVESDRAVWPGAGVHVHDIGAGTAVDGVPGIPVRNVDGVVAGEIGETGRVAADRVHAVPAVDRVVATLAVERIARVVAAQYVVGGPAGGALDRDRRRPVDRVSARGGLRVGVRSRQVDGHGRGELAKEQAVGPGSVGNAVFSPAVLEDVDVAVDDVGDVAAVQHVVAWTPVEGIGAEVSGEDVVAAAEERLVATVAGESVAGVVAADDVARLPAGDVLYQNRPGKFSMPAFEKTSSRPSPGIRSMSSGPVIEEKTSLSSPESSPLVMVSAPQRSSKT